MNFLNSKKTVSRVCASDSRGSCGAELKAGTPWRAQFQAGVESLSCRDPVIQSHFIASLYSAMPKFYMPAGAGSKVGQILRGSEGGKARQLQLRQLEGADDAMNVNAESATVLPVEPNCDTSAQGPATAAAAAPHSAELDCASAQHAGASDDNAGVDHWQMEAESYAGDRNSYSGDDHDFDDVRNFSFDAIGQHPVHAAVDRGPEVAARPPEFDDPPPEEDGDGGDWDAWAASQRVPLALPVAVPLTEDIPLDGAAAALAVPLLQAGHAPNAPPAANAPPIDPDFAFDPRFRFHDSIANQPAPTQRQVCNRTLVVC